MTVSDDVRALELLPDPEDVSRVNDVAAVESAGDFLVALEADVNDVQERLTTQIADWLQQQLEPKASASFSRRSTCAWRCGASRRLAPRSRRRRCTGSSGTTLEPARSSWR